MFLVITKSVRILYAGNISAYTNQSIFPPTPYPLVFPLIRYHPLLLLCPCRYPCHQCKKCRRDTLKPITTKIDLSRLKSVCLAGGLIFRIDPNWINRSIWSIFRRDLELTRFIGGVPPSKCVPTYTTLFTFYIFLHKLYGPPFHTVVLLHSFCFYSDKPQILPY